MYKYAVGIDVGGTSVKMGLFTEKGDLLDKWSIKTDKSDNGSKILPDIADSVKKKLAEKGIDVKEVSGAGIGLPGSVDEFGVINGAVNLYWTERFNVEEMLGSRLDGMRVRATNDANAAALGETWKGAAEGYKDVVMVTLGTGIGGGIVINGKIYAGVHGSAGEIGHICLNRNETERCNCGNRGCFEQYSSATGLMRLLKRELRASNESSSLRYGEISAKALWDAVKKGDALGCRVAEEFSDYLGLGLASVATVVNPQLIVIGGGVSLAGDILIEYMKKYFLKYVMYPARDTEFALAKLGNDGGIYGCAKMVLE